VAGTSAVWELEDLLLLLLPLPLLLLAPLVLPEPRDDIVAFYWMGWWSGTVVGFEVVMWRLVFGLCGCPFLFWGQADALGEVLSDVRNSTQS
jgi:hypothetical protein